MTSNASDHQVYASYRQLLYWLLLYALLDVIIWAVIVYLQASFLALPRPKSGGMVHLGALLIFMPMAIIGKVGILQFPFLLLIACVFRKKVLLLKRRWALLPITALFTTVIYLYLASSIDGGWSKGWESLSHEWTNYSNFTHMAIPFALLSALIATVPWMIFLKRKFKSLKA